YTPPANNTLSFGPGVTSQNLSIPILDDNLVEGNETVNLALQSVTDGATLLAPPAAVLTITDNDVAADPGQLQFSSATYSVAENRGTASLTITRPVSSDGTLTLQITTPFPYTTLFRSYTPPANNTLSFGPGVTSQNLSIPILDDNLVEGNETVNLALQ